MPSSKEPTKTSASPSPTSSAGEETVRPLTKEEAARAIQTLKEIMPSVIAKPKPKPKPKKPIPRHVN